MGVPSYPVTKMLLVYLPSPKSHIFMSLYIPISTFYGLKSRCIFSSIIKDLLLAFM